jgi:hypothetical protein
MSISGFKTQLKTIGQALVRRLGYWFARLASVVGFEFGRNAAKAIRAKGNLQYVKPYELSDVPVRAHYVRVFLEDDDAYIKPYAGRNALHINRTALGVWRQCNGDRTVKEIVSVLAWTFQEQEGRTREGVLSTLRYFEAHGVVYRSSRDAPARRRKPAIPPARPKVFGIGWTFAPNHSSNSVRQPKHFDWTDNRDHATVPLTVCIGHGIKEGLELPGTKIAWLVESPAIAQMQRLDEFVLQNLDQVLDAYDIVLSSDRAFCELDAKIEFHPSGSNLPWIHEKHYRIYPKRRLCSMFASSKLMVEGHHVRHNYAQKFKDRLDLYGGAYGSPKIGSEGHPPDKRNGLVPYMFNVAMENCQVSLYYTEKLTDCFVTGTVPVYWGSADVGEIFDEKGIIVLDDDFDLNTLTPDLYQSMMPHIKNNFEIARNLPGSDDELFEKYIRT